ncbi:response regulator [Notoacmeibacter sp. MSK16QG-6]|uniref:response regulator n=1 Tax=Notoacmeibacter sp. MSK16QG-6 TaxID=2957982 RepID=UPI00209ECF92|nr:response regulator [Notoacmeibacter sp. MSK16QG-6]MCP1199980.1 response regulator [Notoacmeibacter sp. MSK16QG-6]
MARILIVEDDDAVRHFTARALTRDGHIVETAEDGDLGLEIIEERQGQFDLVLSDIRMPAMDGIAMAMAVAERFPHLPILLMTGYAEQREQASEVKNVVIDVLSKPFELADLRSFVSQALTERKAA